MLKVSEEEKTAIDAAAKANRNKRAAKRLEVLELRYLGKSNAEISTKTGFNERYITTLMGLYKKQGLNEFIRIKQKSHRRNLSEEEEANVLAECEKDAEAGKILTVEMIREKHKPQLCISGNKAAGMAEGDAAIKVSEIREPGGAGLLKELRRHRTIQRRVGQCLFRHLRHADFSIYLQ